MIVVLTESEILHAGFIAAQRQAQNLSKGRADAYGAKRGNGLDLHFQGCMGEIALAKGLNLFWSGQLGNLRASDVSKFQVRATTLSGVRGPEGNLLLHPNDSGADCFVLVRLDGARADLRGYILGSNGKKEEFWKPDGWTSGWRACFRVPEGSLQRFKADRISSEAA